MKACIVRPHHAGLFSLINNVVTCLSLYDYVYVDWSEGCIYGNAWPHLFFPNLHPSEVPGITQIDVIGNYPHQALTYKNAGILYPADSLLGWRQAVNRHWFKLTVQTSIYRRVIEFTSPNLGASGEYTAVLIRGNGHAGEQLHNRAQTRDDYARAIETHRLRERKIFVAAADTESLEWFRDRFDIVVHPETRRSNSRDIQPHLEAAQTIEDAVQCMIEVIIMANAGVFIHPVSNMATAALYMNPALQSVFLA